MQLFNLGLPDAVLLGFLFLSVANLIDTIAFHLSAKAE